MTSIPPRIVNDNPSALPPGTRLGEFELLSLLGVGGFGIVYLAFDHALEREVAVKEYMPASLAGRTETLHVSVRSQSDADTFALGLRSFVNEARMLARFDHPSLLKVHRFWEANGTAYMAMPVMHGQTLKEVRAAMGHAPDEAWLREMLTPLLGAIEKLHSEGVYHRDIAPDNIQIGPEGLPVLLDFGAARRVISDKSQTLTAILKPAYAPIEQYAEAGSVKQGPWTDLYALGATLHYLLLNRPPPPATTRAIHDEASALSTTACAGCSETFLRAIDWMLAPRPADRPQNVAALRDVLDGRVAPPLRRVDSLPPVSQWDRTVVLDAAAPGAPGANLDLDLTPGQAPGLGPGLGFDPEGTRIVPPPLPAAADDATVYEPPLQKRAAPAPAPALAAAAAPAPAPISTSAPAATPAPAPARALAAHDFAAPPVSGALGSGAAAPRGAGRWLPAALGVGLLAVAVAGFALWPRAPATPPGAAAADGAASAAPAALSGSAAAPAAPVATGPAPVAESAITTVVVPAAPAPNPALANTPPRAAAAPTAPSPNPPTTGAATVPGAGSTERQPRAPGPARVAAPAPAGGTLPEPARGQAATPGTAPATTSTSAPAAATTAATAAPTAAAPPPEPAKAATASGPEAVCEGRNPVLYFVCMERECLRAKFQAHGDCVKWRKEARREGN